MESGFLIFDFRFLIFSISRNLQAATLTQRYFTCVDQRRWRKKLLEIGGSEEKGSLLPFDLCAMAIIESTSTSAKNVRKENSVARIVGSGSAGILELALFHPVISAANLRLII